MTSPELKIYLSNERSNPTLVRLDHVFCSEDWDLSFETHISYGASLYSILMSLSNQSGPPRPKQFKFENFWIHMLSFQHVIQMAWTEHNPHSEPFHRLNYRLPSTARRLKEWSKLLLYDTKWQIPSIFT